MHHNIISEHISNKISIQAFFVVADRNDQISNTDRVNNLNKECSLIRTPPVYQEL